MNNLNSVLIEGNLTRDPEVFELASDSRMTRFAIGVNRHYLSKEKEFITESSFFTVITWGRTADNCAKYLRKGRGVRVLGRLRQERWVGKDNEPRERIVIVADHVEFQPERNKNGKKNDDTKPQEKLDLPPEVEIDPLDGESIDEGPGSEERAIEIDASNPGGSAEG